MSFMRSKNGAILIIAGVIILGGLIGVGVYYALFVPTEGQPSNPTTTIPPTTHLETTTDPKNTDPTTDPENTEPTSTEPSTTKPENTKPTSTEPSTNKPENTEPTSTEPSTTKPENTEPTSTEPSTTKPENTEPTSTEPSTTKPVPIDPTATLLFASTTDGRILRIDPNSENYATLVHEETYLVKTFEYYRKNQTLFYGTAKPYEPLKSWNGKHDYSMEKSAKWTKTAMAIDYVTENIYVLDGMAEKLYVLDKNTGYYAVVLTDLDEPKDVVIDSKRRRMFILQKTSILSVDLDGQREEIIQENGGISAFAIDRNVGTLYYTYNSDGKNYIRYFEYAQSIIQKNLVIIERNILSMAVFDDKLFYISTSKNDTGKALNYCYLSKECGTLETVKMEDEQAIRLSQIKSYEFVEEETVNPCANNNGECSHLCISADNVEKHVCKCNARYQLDVDSKTCSIVEDYLMYVQGNTIKGRTLDDEGRSFVDMDIDIEILDSQKNQDIYFDYDSHTNMLVYASGPTVHYRDLSNGSEWSFEDDTGCEVIPVIDWVSKNLYNIRNCNDAKRKNYFSVRKLYERSKDELELWIYAKSIKSFVVLPNQGKVFFTLHVESVNKTLLHMGHLNNHWQPQANFEAHETGLTVDFEHELIYYLMSVPVQSFGFTFNLSDVKENVDIQSVRNPRSIGVFEDHLYVANANEVWRFGKNATTMMMRVKDEIQSFRIYSKKLQPVDPKNPCSEKNGGCQRYCFAVPSKDGLESECKCNQTEYLNSDKKTCSREP